ncbi:MAG: methyl-accepting chemotaxis protein, partial [Flavobacteriales bacterium]
MNFKFTISRKISLGFGLFILVVAVVLFITTRTLTESIALTRDINERHSPTLYHLNILKNNVSESVALAENWVLYQTRSDSPSKLKLEKLVNEDIPKKTIDLSAFASDWELEDRLILEEITEEIQTLTVVYGEIKSILPSFESYSPINMMNAEFLIEDENKVDTISKQLYEFIGMLIDRQQKIISAKSKLMAESFSRLLTELVVIFIFVLFSGVIIAHFTIRSIVKPVKFLKRILLYLGKGIFPTTTMNISNDEIGDMSFAVKRLVEGLKRTTEFANEVGAGNFDAKYEPLSEDDELGRELLKMRDDLAE